MTQYRVVYDAARAGFQTWKFPLAGLVPVAVGLIVYLIFRNGDSPRERVFGRLAGPFAAIVGALWTIAAWSSVRGEYEELTTSLSAGRYAVVEGVVTEFVAEGGGGHPPESWTVAGHHYVISSYVVTSGFAQPGVVSAGMRVRIADVDGAIARLEAAR